VDTRSKTSGRPFWPEARRESRRDGRPGLPPDRPASGVALSRANCGPSRQRRRAFVRSTREWRTASIIRDTCSSPARASGAASRSTTAAAASRAASTTARSAASQRARRARGRRGPSTATVSPRRAGKPIAWRRPLDEIGSPSGVPLSKGPDPSPWGITAYRPIRAGYRCLRWRPARLPRRHAMTLPLLPLTDRASAYPGSPVAPSLEPAAPRTRRRPSGPWWPRPSCSARRGGVWAQGRAAPSAAGMGESSASSRSTSGVGASATASGRRA